MTHFSLRTTAAVAAILMFVAVAAGLHAQTAPQRAQPIKAGEVPSRKQAAPLPPRGTFVPPRTPWGDPDIAGDYNNSDESGIPFERPDEFAGRRIEDILAGGAREAGEAAAAADHRARRRA